MICATRVCELPLELRRQQLCLQYICKFRSNPCNFTFNSVFGTVFRRLFEARPNNNPKLGIRMNQNILDSDQLQHCNKLVSLYSSIWLLIAETTCISVIPAFGLKSEVAPSVFQSKFYELFSQYDGYTRIFTD